MRDKMNLRTLSAMTEPQARAYFESIRWPNGPVCPLCAVVNEATKIERHKADSEARDGLYQCRACRNQFTVTVGTVMEASHLPIRTWLMAINLLCAAKKSMSAKQLQRHLGIGSYRTAWHLAHRIRHMMANGGPSAPLTGVVEVDEVHVASTKPGEGRKSLRKDKAKREALEGRSRKQAVQVLVQRGGSAKARAVPDVRPETLKPFIRAHVAFEASIHSDEGGGYVGLDDEFAGGHFTVNHSAGQYADGTVTSNTAESFNALFKRALHGSWHHVSREHLGRYLDEQCFRWSLRKVSDWDRTRVALKQAEGVRLYYKQPRREGEDGNRRLVAG
jgi:transposase-like protein